MALYVDKHRPKDLDNLDYHKAQAKWLKALVGGTLNIELEKNMHSE